MRHDLSVLVREVIAVYLDAQHQAGGGGTIRVASRLHRVDDSDDSPGNDQSPAQKERSGVR
jgi:hypothetical protein